jgi:sugar lactone lactonase YvrE
MRRPATIRSGIESIQSGLAGILLLLLTACSVKPEQGASPVRSVPDSGAPAGLAYKFEDLILVKRTSFPEFVPILSSGEAKNFSISPALPEGLTFNFKTGAIGGTPKNATLSAPYRISANNSKGVVTTTLNIEVQTTSRGKSKVNAMLPAAPVSESMTIPVSVTLLSESGHPIVNERVTLSSVRGPDQDTIEAVSPVTNSAGVANFTVRSKVAGSAVLFAYDLDDQVMVLPVATVNFIPGPLHHFSFSKVPSSVSAGSPSEIIIKARDVYENLCTSHEGSIHLQTSDPKAVIQDSTAVFSGGAARFESVILKTAGIRTVTVQDDSLELGPRDITVLPADPHHLAFRTEPPNLSEANSAFDPSPEVAVLDEFDNAVTEGSTSITLAATSDDSCESALPGAMSALRNPLPSDSGLASFQGVRVSKITAKRVRASASNPKIIAACSGPMTVFSAPASAANSYIQGSGTLVADGVARLEVKIHLEDANGNPVSGITPVFEATDTGSVNQYGTCSPGTETGDSTCYLSSTKAEAKTLKLLEPVVKTGSTVAFISGPATSFLVSGYPSRSPAGTTGSVTINVLDANLNPVTGYQGVVSLSSSDPKAVLPGDFAFHPSDLGLKLIPGIQLRSSGTHTLTVTDSNEPSIQGSQSGLNVSAGTFSAAQSILGAEKTRMISGETIGLSLVLRDAYGNPDPKGEPQIKDLQFSTSLVGGTGTFSDAIKSGQGSYQSGFTAVKSGQVTVSAKIDGIAVEKSVNLEIDPGSATRLVLSGIPSPVQAGSAQNLTVTAKDAAGNTASDYSGEITLGSSDTLSVLEGTKALSGGTGTFSVVLKSAGSKDLSAGDGILSGSLSGITVTPGPYSLSRSTVTPEVSTLTSNHSTTITLILRDLYGNRDPRDVPDPGYIHFTSTADTGTGTFGPVQNLGSGVLTSTFTGKKSGIVSVSASISNQVLSGKSDLEVTPDAASSLLLSGMPAEKTAGQGFSVSISALDSNGNRAVDYAGIPVFTSSDAAAILPGNDPLTSGSGSRSITFKTAGNHTLVASDGTLSVTSPVISITPAAAASLSFQAIPSSALAGSPFPYSLRALDAFGNIATGYSGTIQLSSTDSKANLPSSPVLSSGVANFSTILKSSGSQTLSVGDGTLTAESSPINVNPDAYSPAQTQISVSSSSVSSGESITVKLTPRDLYGNKNPSGLEDGSGIAFTSSLIGGTGSFGPVIAQPDGTFTSVFTGNRAGAAAIGASIDGNPVSASATVVIHPGVANSLVLANLPASSTAGSNVAVTVTAYDSNGNVATGFTTPVALTSSDASAVLPGSASLTNGSADFSVTLKTAGSQSLAANAGALASGPANVSVNPAAYSLAGSSISAANAGVKSGDSVMVTITMKDSFGNPDPAGLPSLSEIQLSTSLSGGGGNFGPITALGQGVYQSLFTGTLAGQCELKATVSGLPLQSSAPVSVTAGTATRLELGSVPATVTSGESFSFSVTAKDAAGNTATGFSGPVSITSPADAAASLPPSANLSSGTGTFTATLRTAGIRGLTAAGNGLSVSSAGIVVDAAAAASLVLESAPASISAGDGFTVSVTARDAAGNIATGHSRQVSIQSSLPGATLPASAVLVNGVGSFPVALKKSGLQTLSATDGVLSANSGPIQVNPAAFSASQSVLSSSSSTVASGSDVTLTLTTKDSYGNLNPVSLPALSDIQFQASLPGGNGNFGSVSALGAGVYSVNFTGVGAGASILSSSIGGALVGNTVSMTITPGAPSRLVLGSLPATSSAGSSVSFTVTAKDPAGNTAPSYSGQVQFTSSDGNADLPATSGLTQGTRSFSAVFRTAGSQTISASDGNLSASGSIAVDASGASQFTLAGIPASVSAGDTVSVTVTARDQNQNIASTYSGRVAISSSDPQAGLPASATLIQGTGTFVVQLKSAGSRTLTASDGSIAKTSSAISVSPGPFSPSDSSLELASNAVASGSGIKITLSARDAFGNQDPSGINAVAFTTGFAGGTGSFGNVTQDGSGVYSAVFTGELAGLVPVGFTINGSPASGSKNVTVTPGPASRFVLSGVPESVDAGVPFSFTVTAKDAFGNLATSFSSAVSITSGDSAATLPAPKSLDNAEGSFGITLNTSGSTTLTVASGSITATSSPITVNQDTSSPASGAPGWFVKITSGKVTCPGVAVADGLAAGILTAADCLGNSTANDLQIEYPDHTTARVSALATHTLYDSGTLAYDLALVTTSGQTAISLDVNSDFAAPASLSTPFLYGLDLKLQYAEEKSFVTGKTPDLRAFDPVYMFSSSISTNQGSQSFLGEPAKSASGYRLAGLGFYSSDGVLALIDLTAPGILAWIKESFASSPAGVTTLAGDGTRGSEDGSASAPATARLNQPQAVLELSNGDLLIADTGNQSIRYFEQAKNLISTLGTSSSSNTGGTAGKLYRQAAENTVDSGTARFSAPAGLARNPDHDIIYVSDRDDHTIQQIDLSGTSITATMIAGISGRPGADDGPASDSTFSSPSAIAWYQGGLLILDSGNRSIRFLKDGAVSTLLDSNTLSNPSAIAADSNGNVYIADRGDHTIRLLDASGNHSILAGTSGTAGSLDGETAKATFNLPTGIAVDSAGNVYISEAGNHLIRKIDTRLEVTTIAGNGNAASVDGSLLSAGFNAPGSLTLLSGGSLLVSEPDANLIRKIILPK